MHAYRRHQHHHTTTTKQDKQFSTEKGNDYKVASIVQWNILLGCFAAAGVSKVA